MWSKNGIPVLILDFPVPSRLRRMEILVSSVWRLILDWRAFIAEIKPERRRKDQAELRDRNLECGDVSPLSHDATCRVVPKRGHVRALQIKTQRGIARSIERLCQRV